jgi:DNA-directed RNA polymerase subunit RPC12/RpoP
MHKCSKCKKEIGGSDKPTAYNSEGKWTCPKHTPDWIIQRSLGISWEEPDDDLVIVSVECSGCGKTVNKNSKYVSNKCYSCRLGKAVV